jgi:hypothetical protein
MWWLRWLRRGLLFLRAAEYVMGEDGIAGVVWLTIVLLALSWR